MKAILTLKFKRMLQEISLYVIMILMAVLLTFIFSKAMAGGGAKRVYVTDLDDTEYSRMFLDYLYQSPYSFEKASKNNAIKQVQRSGAVAAIVIEKGLMDSPKIEIIYGSDSIEAAAIKNAAEQAYDSMVHLYFLQEYISENGEPLSIGETQAAQNSIDKLVGTVLNIKNAPKYDALLENNFHFLMGFNIFFVTFSIIFTIGSILEDKQLKIWQRMRLTPIGSIKILLGNFLPSFMAGVAQMAVVLFVGQYLMGIKLASLGTVLLVFTVYSLTATCLGLFLCAILKNYAQLNSLTPIITVSTSMIGGCMWPLSIINSPVMLMAANFTPQRWAMQGAMRGAILGKSADILSSLLILLGMAAVFFTVSVIVLQREGKNGK
jgi:ABC-2 type transport system permease protein